MINISVSKRVKPHHDPAFFCLTYLVLIAMAVALGADMTVSYILYRPSKAIIIKETLSDSTCQGVIRQP